MPLRLCPTLAEAKLRACEALWNRGGALAARGGLQSLVTAIEAVRAAPSIVAVRAILRQAVGGTAAPAEPGEAEPEPGGLTGVGGG